MAASFVVLVLLVVVLDGFPGIVPLTCMPVSYSHIPSTLFVHTDLKVLYSAFELHKINWNCTKIFIAAIGFIYSNSLYKIRIT